MRRGLGFSIAASCAHVFVEIAFYSSKTRSLELTGVNFQAEISIVPSMPKVNRIELDLRNV